MTYRLWKNAQGDRGLTSFKPATGTGALVGGRRTADTMPRYQCGGLGARGWRRSNPPPLYLNQNGLIVLQVFLDAPLVGKRQGRPFGFVLDELVVHEVFADKLDVKT